MTKQVKHKIKVKRKRVGRKKFFDVSVPLTATRASLYGYAPEDFIGNTIKIDLSKAMRGKSVELRARAIVVKGELRSELTSMVLMQSYIKRVMRRGTDYVEDSFEVTGRESIFRIKPFLITRNRVSRAVRNALRVATKKHLENKIKTMETEDVFSQIMTNKLQKELSLRLKKIYPLALCEIRALLILRSAEKKTKKVEETKETPKSE